MVFEKIFKKKNRQANNKNSKKNKILEPMWISIFPNTKNNGVKKCETFGEGVICLLDSILY